MIGAKYSGGESRVSQLERLGRDGFRRFFKLEKTSFGKYRVDEIYENPLPATQDKSLGNSRGVHKLRESTKNNPNFSIEEDDIALNSGVYKIENNEAIYIGSTINKLTRRFKNHCDNPTGQQPKTQELINNGGIFTCLQSFPLGTDEQIIRDSEAYHIWKNQNTDKELINVDLPELVNSKKKIEYENLNIPVELHDEVLNYLREGGFLIMGKNMYNKRFKEDD